jgi:N-acetylglucosaminyl-diphospho-decaprenol L-rhamnosyltransferase
MGALIATYTSSAGGAERLLLNVAGGLDEPPLIACPAGWLADEARAAGFTVFELPPRSLHVRRSARDRLLSVARLAAHARELHQLVRDVQPDLVVAWGMRTALAFAGARTRLDAAPPWIFQHMDFLPGDAIGTAVRRAAGTATRIVCVSQAVAADLDPTGSLRERTEVIHCGVDTARFTPRSASGGALLLGAIVDWKRPDLALEITALAARDLPDLRLRIAGAPLEIGGEALLVRLRERADQPDLAGRVEFAGRLSDPASALAEAGCLLHCADREPFGLVLVEALASGTPVVAPAAGGPAEIVDATCGVLYPPGDAAAGAGALVETLRRRDELSHAARRRAETAFALDDMQRRYRDLLASTAPGADSVAAGTGIAFVTVTYNSGPELKTLAASIDRHLPGARLVVVDNASSDDSRTVAEAAGATVIALDENRGFGAAANAGVAAVDEPVTVLVNPDVELVDDSLGRLAARVGPGALHAPLLLNEDGSRQDSSHPLPASAATAVYALVPGAATPRSLRPATEPWRSETSREVGWATAACLVARTETLRELGPFDESIFLYAEDLDLGLRAETWFEPDARVIHRGAHSTDRAFGGENFDLLARQRRDVVRRRLGRVHAIVDDLIEMTTFADRALLRMLSGRPTQRQREQLRARIRAMRAR